MSAGPAWCGGQCGWAATGWRIRPVRWSTSAAFAELGRAPQRGEKVIVLRYQNGVTEAAVTEYMVDSAQHRWVLQPAPLALDALPPGCKIEIVRLVVGS